MLDGCAAWRQDDTPTSLMQRIATSHVQYIFFTNKLYISKMSGEKTLGSQSPFEEGGNSDFAGGRVKV